jgi:hypothetical protein
MAMILKQATAVDVLIGPFVDEDDGVTAEEGLSPAVLLSKNGQALAAKNDATTPVHDDAGYYNCELDATDTDTVGTLVLVVEGGTGALPVRHELYVVEEAIYDALFGASATGLLPANVTQIEGSDATDVIDARSQVGAAAALVAYDPPTKAELDAGLAALNDLDAAGVRSAVGLASADLDSQLAALPTAGENADAVWEEDITDHSGTADSTAEALAGATAPSAAAVADAVLDELLSGHTDSGSVGDALAHLDADVSSVSGVTGSGALTRTIGVTVGGNPIEGASVWVATDAAGSNVVAGPLTTDSMGEVTVLLDAGTFYAWVQKDAYVSIIAEEITIS